MYDAGCAMSGLSCFVSADLSRDLANDVMTLLTSTKPYLRKKAVLLMYKIFLKFPESLKPAFPRLKEKLEDPDPGKSLVMGRIWFLSWHTYSILPTFYLYRSAIGCCERDLRISPEESQELSVSCS